MNLPVTLIHYRYDAMDRLLGHEPARQPPCTRFYQDERAVLQTQDGEHLRFIRQENRLLGQSRQDGAEVETVLLSTDQQGSVLQAMTKDVRQDCVYTPYGLRAEQSGLYSLLGFNGELPDPVTGCYMLGNGQRVYNPVLMRFHSPDSMSPFGAGGVNPYAYCLGDPINLSDPTGHFSWRAILGIAIAVVSIAVAVATLGAGAPLAGPVLAAAVLDIGANVLSIAGTLADELAPDSKAGSVLGQLGLALSVASFSAAQIGKRGVLELGKLQRSGYSARSPLQRQGAIKVSNGKSLQGFRGAAKLTSRARNTVVVGERLQKATEILNYVDYALTAFEKLDEYVIPYINPPKEKQGEGESAARSAHGSDNPAGLQGAINLGLNDILGQDMARIENIRGS